MKIEIIETTIEQKSIVANLYQFYLYDFSEMVRFGVEADGRYEESDLDGCWIQPHRHVFLLKVDDELAGMAIVDQPHQSSDYSTDYNEIVEFFVMRKFRKGGVGTYFARYLFDRYRGRWRVAQILENSAGLAFWRYVIGVYMHGQFEDTTWQGKTRTGTVQYFDNGQYGK